MECGAQLMLGVVAFEGWWAAGSKRTELIDVFFVTS